MTEKWITDRARRTPPFDEHTKALLAVEGFSDPACPCIPGELLLAPAPCGRTGCSCAFGFRGATSDGDASIARVTRLRGVPRAMLRVRLVTAMLEHDGLDEADAECAVADLLDEVDTIDEGRLVRREDGMLFPFPAGARIERPGTVMHHLDDLP